MHFSLPFPAQAVASVATASALRAGAHAAGGDTLRIGLVGCGNRGTGAAKDALNTDAHTTLVAMGDVFADHIDDSHRLLTGGAPLQVTRDDADHLYPRWAPDSSSLIYYTPPDDPSGEGALWEVSALGGLPRPIIGALGGGDISHDGRRIAVLRGDEGRVALTTVARDGSDPRPVAHAPSGHYWQAPRWSPDDEWLAFQGRGLATDAVAQMVQRAFEDAIVRAVDAHTLGHANPSTRVLEKSGFRKIGEANDPDEGAVWQWRRERPAP